MFLIAISHDGFSLFEQLIINFTKLIPPNAEQKLRTMNIRLCCQCWCIVRLTSQSSMVEVIVVYPFFIAGHDTMQKTFPFLPLKQLFTRDKTQFDISQLQLNGTLYPCFWIIPNIFKWFETVVWSTPNDSECSACAYHECSWSNASNSLSSNFFGAQERSLSSTSKLLFLKCLNQTACCFQQIMVTISPNKLGRMGSLTLVWQLVWKSCNKIPHKYTFFGTKSSMLNTMKNNVVYTLAKWHSLNFKPAYSTSI